MVLIKIDENQKREMFGEFQEIAASSSDYNLITHKDYQSAEVLFVVLNKGEILISKLTAKLYILKNIQPYVVYCQV